jgi:carbamoyl-phosphate synthase large subunit
LAEDRSKFSALLDQLKISQPPWSKLQSIAEAKRFAQKIGYPVIVRPSYVLSGSAMRVAYNESSLENFLNLAAKVGRDHPVVISKFINRAKEVEVDGVSDGENVFIGAIMEHVENAGVHSGDATMTIPPQALKVEVQKDIETATISIVKALKIHGPYNIQYLVKDDVVNVIECNLRASRSMPFVSKCRGINMIELATLAMLGKKIDGVKLSPMRVAPHVGVKVPQFSFMRLSGADPVLGVEMLSTGEVACLGENFSDAFSKALQSAEFNIPAKDGSVLLSVGGDEQRKARVVPIAKAFADMGFKIYATKNTATVLNANGINAIVLHKVRDPEVAPNILDCLQEHKIDLVINVPIANRRSNFSAILTDGYIIRRQAVEFNVPVITNLQLAVALVEVLKTKGKNGNSIRSLNEYMDDLPWKHW